MNSNNENIVYSTELGSMCAGCNKPVAECVCNADSEPFTGDGIVRVSRQTKGRRGKCVTIIDGVPQTASQLKNLAKKLKRICGSGGTVKDAQIEIQGDHRDRLIEELKKEGFTVKASGG